MLRRACVEMDDVQIPVLHACCCRADVLVRCSGVGQYILSSGVGPNLYGPGVNLNFEVVDAGESHLGIQGCFG